MTSRALYILLCVCGLVLAGEAEAQVKVDEIEITGNRRTKAWVIEREFLLLFPDSIVPNKVSKHLLILQNQIQNTNLFNRVDVHLAQGANSQVLHIELVEKWYSWPIPFVEFSDRNFNIWEDLEFGLDRTNYGLYLFNYNLFGANHTAKLSVVEGYNRKYGFEYRIPALSRRSNTGISLRLQHEEQDELWHFTQDDRLRFYGGDSTRLVRHDWASLGFTHQLESQFRIGVDWAFSRFRVSEEARLNELGQPFLQNGRYIQQHHYLGAYLQHDTRNNRFFATQGQYNYLGAAQEFGHLENFRMHFDHRSFGTINGDHGYAFGAYLEHNTNGSRSYRNNRMFGYQRFVRGYENYVVDGQSAVLFKGAYRYHLLKREYPLDWVPYLNYKFLPIKSFLELYSDAGFVQSSQVGANNRLPNTWLYSAGIGWNVLAYNDKVFRFEFSVNAKANAGWYVHFTQPI